MIDSLRSLLSRCSAKLGFPRDWYLIALGALIGSVTGLGAIAFNAALHLSDHFTRDLQRGSPIWLVVMPAIGMGLSGVLIWRWAVEAKGHGVPQVMKALIQKGGVIRARVVVVKVVASVLTVGSGGSAGTEGPIVQIGASAGSVLGQRLGLQAEQMRTLVGCGAAAGIASIFNAPIAGVFFVLEILLRDFSIKTFTPIVVASVFSSVTRQAVLGEAGSVAIFPVGQSLHEAQFLFRELPSYILLGAICGLVAVAFNRVLHYGEDFYDRLRIHPVLKPITGAVILGLMGVALVLMAGSGGVIGHAGAIPEIFGNGYGSIRHLLEPGTYEHTGESLGVWSSWIGLLAVLVGFKIVGTTLTLASGGSGGVFAPALFLGAAAEAIVGSLLDRMDLIPGGSTPASYALVGMAAVVAASTHAPLTAILILFEMTRNIYVVLPIMLAAVVATVAAQLIERDSIYTAKLRRQGVLVGRARDLTLLRRIPVSRVKVASLPDEPVYASDPLSKLVTLHAWRNVPDFVVVDQDGHYMGMVTGADMRTALIDREAIPLLLVAELMRNDLPTIDPEEHLDSVMDKFSRHDVSSLPIMDRLDPRRPVGLITRARLMRCYQDELERS